MKHFKTLITAEELANQLDDCLVIDCRHNLLDRDAGTKAYESGHIPSARFLHMDDDLASHGDGSNGRHPLPDPNHLRAKLEQMGMTLQHQLVAYDANGGAMAGRLWWLGRWLGYPNCAVLDGGLPAWQEAGFPISTEGSAITPAPDTTGHGLVTTIPGADTITVDALMSNLQSHQYLVIDARAAERYRGQTEPMDPVAGHIPGSVNRPLQANLRPDGRFKPAAVLHSEFEALLTGRNPETVVHSCGSGVSACHNLLAMEHAGMLGSVLYPGSWSEWCADPQRPVGKA